MLALGLVEVHGWYHLHDNLLRVRGQVLLSAQVLSNPMPDVDISMQSESNDAIASSFFAPPSHMLPVVEGIPKRTASEKSTEEDGDGEGRDTEDISDEGRQTLEEGLRDLLSGVQRQVQSAVDAAGHLTDDAGSDEDQHDSSEERQPEDEEHEHDRSDDHKALEETSNTSVDGPQDHR